MYDISEEISMITCRYLDFTEIVSTFTEDLDNLDFSTDSIGFRIRVPTNSKE